MFLLQKEKLFFGFWLQYYFFSSSRNFERKKREDRSKGWGSMFFFVIYRKRLIDGIFAAASCCICFFPLSWQSGRSKLGNVEKWFLLLLIISMLNFLAWSLFILLIIIMVEVWGKERVKGVKITEEGAAVQPLAQEPHGVAPHGRSMLNAARHCCWALLFTSHQFEVVHLL